MQVKYSEFMFRKCFWTIEMGIEISAEDVNERRIYIQIHLYQILESTTSNRLSFSEFWKASEKSREKLL